MRTGERLRRWVPRWWRGEAGVPGAAASVALALFLFASLRTVVTTLARAAQFGSARRGEIRAAYRQGFEEIAPWPIEDDEQLDGFHAARQVILMNYAGRTLPMGEAEEYLAQVTPGLRRYVDHYG